MNIENIISLVLGTIGTITGFTGVWLSIKATRQDLTIIQTENKQLSFAVVNHTLRPIPIQSIELFHTERGKQVKVGEPPKLDGLVLPGILPSEARLDIRWNGIPQMVDIIVHNSFTLTVETQTGRKITLKTTAQK